jgi:uncharacterized protein (TIGR00661 family)
MKANIKQLFHEVKTLPIKEYDFVINDFEPVSAWACYLNKIPCISLSHQASLLHKNVPKPKGNDIIGKFIIRNYAPSNVKFGFHFSKYSKSIFTPVIRRIIRDSERTDEGHYTVYLPSYNDEFLIEKLSMIKNIPWQIFSKHATDISIHSNITVFPINNESFVQSLISSAGVLCGAGFETPAEALFLGKKLLVVPMSNQYEQHCNAVALKAIGVPVLNKIRRKNIEKIAEWVASDYRIEINYPDCTEKIISLIFESHVQNLIRKNKWHDKPDLYISLLNERSKMDNPKKQYKAFKKLEA